MRTMHEETAHARPSCNTLRQENQPITSPLLRPVQMIKTEAEIAQPRQDAADRYDGAMELCVEESADDEGE